MAVRGGINNLMDGMHFGRSRRLPMIFQTDPAENGMACLAMIANYYGHDINLVRLRHRFPEFLKDVTLARLMAIGGRLGLNCRVPEIEIAQIRKLKTPSILQLGPERFVVLKRAGKQGVVIHDPARGICKLGIDEVRGQFCGGVLEVVPSANFAPVIEKKVISLATLTGNVSRLLPALIQIFILAITLEIFALVGPFYLQWVIDQVLVSDNHGLLSLLGFGFIAITIFSSIITAARSWAVAWLSATLGVQWASNLFRHLILLPLDWFEKRHVGDVISRFGSIQTIQKTLTTNFISSLLDGFMSLATLVMMGFYSVMLTALVFALFLGYWLIRWVFFNPLRRANEEQIICVARQQSELLESVRGAMPIQLANKQEERSGRYDNATVAATNHGIGIQRLGIAFTLCNQLMFGLGRIAMIWIAAILTLERQFSTGMLIAFIAFSDQFTRRAVGLIDKWVDFRMLRLHLERVTDIALAVPERYDCINRTGVVPESSIELCNVSFRYTEESPWVLRGCNLHIEAGKSVAIVGPSGCGKSTLVKILLGLLSPVEGEVRYGGVEIKKLGLGIYRQWVSAVMQDDQLFAGSLAENISFFDTQGTLADVIAAASAASIHEDIVAMPMAYQSLVGDMGSTLSGGQKQRVMLARALYRQPKVLVLDEATSHLDVERERLVNVAVQRMEITRIIIAHRRETIESADRVIHLSGGQVGLSMLNDSST